MSRYTDGILLDQVLHSVNELLDACVVFVNDLNKGNCKIISTGKDGITEPNSIGNIDRLERALNGLKKEIENADVTLS